MNFYDNIVPQTNFVQNTFSINQNKKLDPCQYDFYNEHVNKVLLPYNRPDSTNINMLINEKILELKIDILNKITFYKSNSFTFNYNRSFFMDAKKYVLDYLTPDKNTFDNTYTPIENQNLQWWNRESLKQKLLGHNS